MSFPLESGTKTRVAPAIIPVLDLMIGQIVLARNGERDQYSPIHTKLTKQSDPPTVARALFGQTGCDCLYLADLDSFEGAKPNWRVYEQLLDIGFQLWVDADWLFEQDRLEVFEKETHTNAIRPIISTEQITDETQFETVSRLCEKNLNPVFSVDFKNGKMLSKCESLCQCSASEIVRRALDCGVQTVIWLDLGMVGSNCGVEKSLAQINRIKTEYPEVVLVSGGGVRTPQDAVELLSAGCQHVLVASAIHECKFRPDDVTHLNDLRNSP